MFLVKRIITWLIPIISSQLFWLIQINQYWYYYWLAFWLVGGALMSWFILGLAQKKHWLYVGGQYLVMMIMPAFCLTLVTSAVLQALLTVFLAVLAIGYYSIVFERFLLKNEPIWAACFFSWILGFDLILSLVAIYGLVEFLNFSFWLSAVLAGLLIGFFSYLQVPLAAPAGLVEQIGGRLISFLTNQSSPKETVINAVTLGLLTVELFLVVWLLPIVFYLKAFIVSWILILWVSQPHPNHLTVYRWKWLLSGLVLITILLLSRWF